MVDVGGRPFLEHIVRHLSNQGFREILLLTGYLGEHISDHFGNGNRFGVSITYSREARPLGTGGAVRAAWNSLDENFLLLYGDSFLPIDYRELAREFQTSMWPAMVVIYDNQSGYTDVKNNIATDRRGQVIRYAKGVTDQELEYVDAGALCFRRDVFADLCPGAVVSLEQELFPKLIAGNQLGSFRTTQRFYDIGTPFRLEEFTTVELCSSLEPPSA
jgi:NDP-sugar pyrophosphorylase family protein